jgi:hypothetical protein
MSSLYAGSGNNTNIQQQETEKQMGGRLSVPYPKCFEPGVFGISDFGISVYT